MSNISQNIKQILKEIPQSVKLIAVSKRQPDAKLWEAYDAGHRIFGENLVQELVRKNNFFPKDIEWHMIGHLQKNKVKYIVPFVHCIHSVDSLDLLKEINKRAEKVNRKINCLFEIHIAKEASKFGLSSQGIIELLETISLYQFPFIKFSGLMGMATYTNNEQIVHQEFKMLHTLFTNIKQTYFSNNPDFKEISMGMSSDYKIAIDTGSTMVRIGTTIFGERLSK